jgi:nucleoside-diphosphate-sugar epimerase
MRVFVAGATGAIGRSLVPQLLAAGHEVTAISRSEERAAAIRKIGVEAVVCDVFDVDRLEATVAAAEPDAIVHQLTSLPEAVDLRDLNIFDATNRLRDEGSRILVDAARAAGVRRILAQSIAFAYAPTGEAVKEEDAPLYETAAQPLGEAVQAVQALERNVTDTVGIEGTVLRYGWLYGPGTFYGAAGSTNVAVRDGRYPIIGEGGGLYSFVQVDDAAAAAVAALGGAPPGIYNVVDDEPALQREWLPAYAEAIGADPPPRVSEARGEALAGPQAVEFATALRGASNASAKRALGWRPRYPSWRDGFTTCAGELASSQ